MGSSLSERITAITSSNSASRSPARSNCARTVAS
ncbi:Uncharacterised protein [Mycobacteroides abscessus subsp. abscessus]|nr:Uncharacterised protein [Mycobacteroides abscessus subsp. abscessus]